VSQANAVDGRTLLGALGGVIVIPILSSILTLFLGAYDAHWNSTEEEPKVEILLALLAISSAASFIGGYLAATIAGGRRWGAVISVGVIVTFLNLMATIFGQNQNPIWYSCLSVAMPAAAILLGRMVQQKYPISPWHN